MRIGMISPYSLTLNGGVQGQILGLAKALRCRGIEVRVLGPCDGPPPETSITPLGNSLPTASNGSIAPIAPDLAASLRTLRALRDEQFDLLHLHEPLAPGPAMTALITKPAPLIGTFHAAGVSKSYKWLNPVLKKLINRLDVRCAVSVAAEKMVKDALGGEYKLLFNAIEIHQYVDLEAEPNETPTIFFLGRHEQRKGLKVLIQAMKELPQNVHLEIAGDGPETENLRSLTRNDSRIKWLGGLSTKEKNLRLKSADLFCVPSLSGESFGVVLLEAMAAGTPIVASNLEGYSSVARPEKDAVLVPPGDPQALAVGIQKVLSDSDYSRNLIQSGLKRVQDFSLEHLAKCYEDIYLDCVRYAR